MKTLRRTLNIEVRIDDAKQGIVTYIASDETLDSYREVILAAGWRFTNFEKNAPFVDSHDYQSIDRLLGKVIDFKVEKKTRRLVETVQWAIDAGLPENHLANIGWKMTEAGYLKAVSVGFWPVKMASRWDSDPALFNQQLTALDLADAPDALKPRAIYLEQEQVELSACIMGANPNALAKMAEAYKAGVISDGALETLSTEYANRNSSPAASHDAPAAKARAHRRQRFLEALQQTIKTI